MPLLQIPRRIGGANGKTGKEMTRNLQSLSVTKAPELDVVSADTRFSAVLRDSISEGMSMVIGVDGTQAMLYYLGLPSLDNPEEFHEKLTGIFGSGTAALERAILQRLHQAVGVSSTPMNDHDFVNQVELARRSFDETAKGRDGAS
jgi:hypothetical protein